MNYFNDRALHSTDPKGRLLLPKDVRQFYRIKKGDVLHLIPNASDPPYLEIRTAANWDKYLDSLREQGASEKTKNSFRYAVMSEEKVKVDGQGRVLLPQRVRDLCKLDGTVAVVNMKIYIEVWAKEHMDRKYADMVKAFKETNDKIF